MAARAGAGAYASRAGAVEGTVASARAVGRTRYAVVSPVERAVDSSERKT